MLLKKRCSVFGMVAVLLFVGWCGAVDAGEAVAKKSVPVNKQLVRCVVLTDGIVGGFVPAMVRLKLLVFAENGKYHVWTKTQKSRRGMVQHHRGEITKKQFDDFLTGINQFGVTKLPLESPRGGEDIYRLDTSLLLRVGKTFWRNGGPGGCVHQQSKVQATAAQKKQFASAVSFAKAFGKKHATKVMQNVKPFPLKSRQLEKVQ